MMLGHLETIAQLQRDFLMQNLEVAQGSAQLCGQRPRPDALAEYIQLAEATRDRAVQLHLSWARDWGDWINFAASIRGADTLPKYVLRLGNIGLQAETLVALQAEQATELAENVRVSYAHWIAQQLDD